MASSTLPHVARGRTRPGGPHTFDTASAVIGSDLILAPQADGLIALFHVVYGHARSLGVFRDAAEAWRVVDAIDVELPVAA